MKIANLAYCGLLCTGCPIQWISRQTNEQKRQRMKAEVVRLYNEQLGIQLKLEEITACDGCKSEGGSHFSLSKDCPIRLCAKQKKYDSCAQCDIYPCSFLDEIFKSDPAAKTRLNVLRAALE
jgi:hypothetical protein